jgi:putative NADH-flavin reductase
MQNKLKLAIIGGTGKSGKYLVHQLLRQGYHFKLLIRNPFDYKIQSPQVEVVKGDARDYQSVRLLLGGCQAVISTLGQPRGETPIFSQATKNVIQAMTELNIKRYILTTGLNVDSSLDKKGAKSKAATDWMKANYSQTTHDKQVEFDVLSNSNIDWTLVRLPLIEQTEMRGKLDVSLEDCPGDKVSATDLAYFLIELLNDDNYARAAPFIATN